MSASTKVLLALRLGPTKAHVCRTCYSYSPKKKLKKTIPPSRQSLLGPRHPGSGAVTRHDLALPPPPPPIRPKLRSLRRAVAVGYWVGTPTSQAFPSSSCFSRRFFFFLEIEIAFFFFAVWPVLDSISFGTHVIGRMIAIAIKDFQKTR